MSIAAALAEEHRAEDAMGQYLQDIRRFPRLSQEQETELAMGCAKGDPEAIKEMVAANLQLVVSVAREYAGRGVPLLDLIQEGSIGLIAAARNFDYTRNVRFSTYATKWIRQGVQRCVVNHSGLIRVPHYTAERMKKVLLAKTALEQETGQEPDAALIAARCDMEEKKVQELLSLSPQVCSLDTPVGEEGDSELQALLEDLQAPEPQEELVRRELKDTMDQLMSMLTDRQRQILRLHYGMADGTCYSLEQIGTALSLSKERVRQIERQAIDKMKAMGADLGLEDFLK